MTRASVVVKGLKLMVITLTALLVACGGGGGGGSTDTTITGSVVAAPVSGASLRVKDTSGNTIAGPVTTGSDGSYSITVPDSALSGTLVFEATGGTFTDEATGLTGTAGLLSAHVTSGSLSTSSAVHLTPASTIVRDMVANHGKTFAQAQTAFEAAFGFTTDTSVAPTDATNPAAGATQAQMLAGLHAAAFSQLTMDLGLTVSSTTEQFDLLPALAQDIVDGTFDGQDANNITIAITNAINMPTDIQNRFTHALVTMHEGTKNKTGIANDTIGDIAFVKLAITNSFTVKYMPALMMMNEKVGKTTFTLRITKNDVDNNPAIGETINLSPIMHMATMKHAAPVDGACTEVVETPGDYQCTVYYLMASSMNGMSMGFWQLNIGIGSNLVPIMMDEMLMGYEMQGGESTAFYPDVMMAMGDTAKVKLKGQADLIMGMMGEEQRDYHLFNDGISGASGAHNLSLFIAAKESMMKFSGVSLNTMLNMGTAYALTANPVLVEVSATPEIPASWVTAVATGSSSGHWIASGITGLADNSTVPLYVKLTINGTDIDGVATNEQKTADGAAIDGSNDYATFMLTTPTP